MVSATSPRCIYCTAAAADTSSKRFYGHSRCSLLAHKRLTGERLLCLSVAYSGAVCVLATKYSGRSLCCRCCLEKVQMLKFRPVQHNQPAHWYAGCDLRFVERQSQLLQHITCSHIPPTQRITQQSTRLTCATVLQHLLGVCRVAGRQVSVKTRWEAATNHAREGAGGHTSSRYR